LTLAFFDHWHSFWTFLCPIVAAMSYVLMCQNLLIPPLFFNRIQKNIYSYQTANTWHMAYIVSSWGKTIGTLENFAPLFLHGKMGTNLERTNWVISALAQFRVMGLQNGTIKWALQNAHKCIVNELAQRRTGKNIYNIN
jgi:hypothetical protein